MEAITGTISRDAQLVMQADTSAVSLQRKNAASANQKWTIEKVAGTEDQYYLKNWFPLCKYFCKPPCTGKHVRYGTGMETGKG